MWRRFAALLRKPFGCGTASAGCRPRKPSEGSVCFDGLTSFVSNANAKAALKRREPGRADYADAGPIPRAGDARSMFHHTYERAREQEKAELRRDMDQRACRQSLWLALYTSELSGWTDVTAAIFEVIATVEARRTT